MITIPQKVHMASLCKDEQLVGRQVNSIEADTILVLWS